MTAVVPFHYLCDPSQSAGSYVFEDGIGVSYSLLDEHHAVFLPLPKPLVMTGGGLCRGALPGRA